MQHLKEFSIELELHRTYWEKVKQTHRDSSIRLTSQSDVIYEAVDFHTVKNAAEVFATIEEYYKDKFPIGQDRFLSG